MRKLSWTDCLQAVRGLEGGQALAFCARPEDFEAPAVQQTLRAALSPEEAARMARFRFPVDQHIYLVAHGLLRLALAAVLEAPAAAVAIETTERGRPQLAPPHRASGLRFNLSHTKGLVACAFALGEDVGVDVENAERRADMEALARTVLADAEQRDLWAQKDENQRVRFFELWTLKESYIKAVGHGLGLPLKDIAFAFPGPPPVDHATVTFGPGIDDQPSRLRFLCRPALSHHQFALAHPAAFLKPAELILLSAPGPAGLASD